MWKPLEVAPIGKQELVPETFWRMEATAKEGVVWVCAGRAPAMASNTGRRSFGIMEGDTLCGGGGFPGSCKVCVASLRLLKQLQIPRYARNDRKKSRVLELS